MKRRLPLIVVLTGLLVVSLAGVAVAAVINCDGSSTCEGTPQPDEITGTDRAEKIFAKEGGDDVSALEGPDIIMGDKGSDEIDGGADNDRVVGGDGDDQRGNGQALFDGGLFGNGGKDRVFGGDGADDVTGGNGPDGMSGGPGNDIVDSFDQTEDLYVDCGSGRDIAYVDRKDRRGKIIENCEEVQRGAAPMSAEQYRAADAELR